MKNHISLKMAYVSIFYVFKINFKKPIIEEKYWIKFKKLSGILFFQKGLGCPELGENEAPLKTHLYFLFRNCFLTQKTLNSSSRSKESHTSFGNFFKKYSKVSVTNFNTKGLVVARKLAARKNKVFWNGYAAPKTLVECVLWIFKVAAPFPKISCL